ncbi:MAG TPA: DUF2905 domain-containing protein [Aggregatilineaceae bacterium]|nr:DUF2905 domain-containing protein [Aggregatilineaceae bacterium]
MDLSTTGRLVLLIGVGLIILGGLLMLFGRIPGLKNLGNLPGDIRVEGKNYTCFFPVVSMIILSVLLSLALNIILRILK